MELATPTIEAATPSGATTTSKKMLWTGRVLSALVVLMLLVGAVFPLTKPPDVVKEFTRLGYGEQVIVVIAILKLVCAIAYAVPQTAVLGAILLTGYLGGAVATHVRVGDPVMKSVMPALFGAVVWFALFLRDARLRALLPVRR